MNPFEKMFNAHVAENKERETPSAIPAKEMPAPAKREMKRALPLPRKEMPLPAATPIASQPTPVVEREVAVVPERESLPTLASGETVTLSPSHEMNLSAPENSLPVAQPQVKRATRRSPGIRLQARDLTILTALASMRVSGIAHMLHVIEEFHPETTEGALIKRMRMLAQHGYIKIDYTPQREVIYLSTEKGNLVSYDDRAVIAKSGGIGTSTAHALLLSYEIAKIMRGESSVGQTAMPIIYTDTAIRRDVAALTREDARWTPPRERSIHEPSHFGVHTRTGIHIPDLVAIDRESGHVLVIEIETSVKTNRHYYSNLLEAYARTGFEVLFVVGNTNINGKPLPALHARLVTDAPNITVIDADMEWARPSGGTR